MSQIWTNIHAVFFFYFILFFLIQLEKNQWWKMKKSVDFFRRYEIVENTTEKSWPEAFYFGHCELWSIIYDRICNFNVIYLLFLNLRNWKKIVFVSRPPKKEVRKKIWRLKRLSQYDYLISSIRFHKIDVYYSKYTYRLLCNKYTISGTLIDPPFCIIFIMTTAIMDFDVSSPSSTLT